MPNNNQEFNNIEKKVNEGINKKYGDKDIEKLLYLIPYNSLAITSSSGKREVPLTLKDVVVAVKEKKSIDKDMLIKIFELYGMDGTKYASSDDEGRMSFERAIEDKIADQIRKIRAAGYVPAGVDDKNNIDSVLELLGRQIVTLNEKQKEKADKSVDRIPVLTEMSELNVTTKKDESRELEPNNENNKKMIEQQVEDTFDFKIHKMSKIDPGDAVFWENNPDIKTKNAYVVLTQDRGIRIIGENDGKFEEVEGFTDPTNESGRTTVIINDEDDLSDNTKNTYGSITSKRDKDLSYTVELDEDGDIGLVERRRSYNGSVEDSDKWISRKVQMRNTRYYQLNLEGNNKNNNTQEAFRTRSTGRNAWKRWAFRDG